MATFAYALRTKQRESQPSGKSISTGQPGNTTWLDAVAALVPAEVLAIHVFAVSKLTSTTEVNEAGNMTAVTTIDDPGALKWTFWVLVAFSAAIYIFKARSSFTQLDIFRVLIPPAAFVLWTMLTPDSAFDAAFPGDLSEARRELIAVIGAAFLGYAAKVLADKADQSNS